MMSSPSPADTEEGIPATYNVSPRDLLDFDGGLEYVEAERLIRIIANSAHNAGRLAKYVRYVNRQVPPVLRTEVPTHSAAMRYAATLRDGLDSLAKLIGGDEFKARTPNWLDPEKEILDDDTKVAEVYRRLKLLRDDEISSNQGAGSQLYDSINQIMMYIASQGD